MYSVDAYGRMIGDPVRGPAYARAIAAAVQPGSIVMDIGSGNGAFAILACQAGAAHVYAIESEGVLEIARREACAAGVADRITFVRDRSTRFIPDERADVIVSDLRGVLPWFDGHFASIADARARLLKAGGVLLPRQDTVFCAPIEAPDHWHRFVDPWQGAYGVEWLESRAICANNCYRAQVTPQQLLAPPAPWTVIDYRTVTETAIQGSLRFEIERDGTLHGVAVWFDTTLVDDIGFSSAPGSACRVYDQTFFPLLSPVSVEATDEVQLTIRVDHVRGEPVWSWKTGVLRAAQTIAQFSQSTFHGQVWDVVDLGNMADSAVPVIGDEGRVAEIVLEEMKRQKTLREIALAVSIAFPARYPDWRDALGPVSNLARTFGSA